jgi:hypothetical protein
VPVICQPDVRVRVAEVEEQNHVEKSEDRKPKAERNPKTEVRIGKKMLAAFQIRDSDFGLASDFGFRISDFISPASRRRQ